MKYEIEIETYSDNDNIKILRDDKLSGGTKSIFMPFIEEKEIKEYVYCSPIYGGFQSALSYYFKDKATIFTPKAKELEPNQEQIINNGSNLIQVPFGYMSNLKSKANNYINMKPNERKLITFGGSDYIDILTLRAIDVIKKAMPINEIWCAIGSGTLIKAIIKAIEQLKENINICGVIVGKEFKPDNNNITIYKYHKPFNYKSKTQYNFPSNPNYDKKAFEYCIRFGKGKRLFWNVYS